MGLFQGVTFAETPSCFVRIGAGECARLIMLTPPKTRKYEYEGKEIVAQTLGVLDYESGEVKLFDLKKSIGKVLIDGDADGLDFDKTIVKISREGSGQKDTKYTTSTIPVKTEIANIAVLKQEAQKLLDEWCNK